MKRIKNVFPVSILFVIGALMMPVRCVTAQTPDWSTSVAAIAYKHCTNCHHPDGIGPFSLMSYDDAATWGYSMLTQINAKLMPPWPPDPNYNHLKDENVLTDDETAAINSWINNYMPIGDINLAPDAPVYNGTSLMINPDIQKHITLIP